MANLIRLEDIIDIADAAERAAAFVRYNTLHQQQQQADATQRLIDVTTENIQARREMSVQSNLSLVPFYDGRTPLKEFIQDTENIYQLLPEDDVELRTYFLRGVIAKLRGKAREALEGQEINSYEQLKTVLKHQFAPSKSYLQYLTDIISSCMKQGEGVRNYHTRLAVLVRGAQAAIHEALPTQRAVNQIPHLELVALQAFLKGVPDSWRATLATAAPRSFAEALEPAVNIEQYNTQSGITHHPGVYHIYHHGIPGEQPPPIIPSPGMVNRPGNKQVKVREYYDQCYDNFEHDNRTQDQENYKQATYMDYNDPKNFDRHGMRYSYDANDVHFSPMKIQDGRINAPPSLGYGGISSQQRSGILKPPKPSAPYRQGARPEQPRGQTSYDSRPSNRYPSPNIRTSRPTSPSINGPLNSQNACPRGVETSSTEQRPTQVRYVEAGVYSAPEELEIPRQ